MPVAVAVIGGGLAGLALAVGLASRGIMVVCIDKAEPSFAEFSAGISLGPNAVEAMGRVSRQMLDACLPTACCAGCFGCPKETAAPGTVSG